jgi:hypothetical protein
LCTLYDKNEVVVYNVQTKERIFRSIFRDATSQVTQLFYVSDFDDDPEVDVEEEYRFRDDEVVADDEEQKPFKGYFLMVENQVNKEIKKNTQSSGRKDKSNSKSYFEKICLVKIVNQHAKVMLPGP